MNWNEMTHEDKDKLISKDVLNLECFKSLEGLKWYEKHYVLGNWHYTTNILDAIDLSNRIIIGNNFEALIVMSKEKYKCHFVNQNKETIGIGVTDSLSESICIAVLKSMGIDIEI